MADAGSLVLLLEQEDFAEKPERLTPAYLKIARAQSGITLNLIEGEPEADFTDLGKPEFVSPDPKTYGFDSLFICSQIPALSLLDRRTVA